MGELEKAEEKDEAAREEDGTRGGQSPRPLGGGRGGEGDTLGAPA